MDLVIVASVEEELGARGLVDKRRDEGPHDGENAGRADDQNPVKCEQSCIDQVWFQISYYVRFRCYIQISDCINLHCGLSPAEGLRVVGLADLYDVQQGLHARSPEMAHVEALEKLKITCQYLMYTISIYFINQIK